MNLKLKRLVRTNTSEQYALYDLDQSDGNEQPLAIGKVDLHFTGEGVYGTLLLWDEATREMRPAQRRLFVNAILAEITQPMGVPNEFVVEFFMPGLNDYELFHNVGLDESVEADEVDEEDLDEEDFDEAEPNDLDEEDLDEDMPDEESSGVDAAVQVSMDGDRERPRAHATERTTQPKQP